MKKAIRTLLFFVAVFTGNNTISAQSGLFRDESSVTSYLEGKQFYNTANGLEVEYGYISMYTTYGIIVKNASGEKFYFINVTISAYGSFADLYGINVDDGGNFGFRLYQGKLVVGRGEPGEQTFFLR
jgi:hypothetical protein